MADKNRKDTFHWNFDLKNTDSDFTDIEYSPEVVPVAEGEDDLKPFIFVDGKYNSDTDASAFSGSARPASDRDEEEEEDDGFDEPKKKKAGSGKLSPSAVFGNNNIPWKKILIGLAALAVIVLLVILLWPKKEKEPGEEKSWALSDDATINLLVENYLTALKEGKPDLMRNVLVSNAKIEDVTIWNQSKIYESFDNTKTYSYPGLNKGEYCLATFTDLKFVNIDTAVPKSYFFYARPEGESNQLRLMIMDDQDTEEYKYFAEVYKDNSAEIQKIVASSDERYTKALTEDEKLAIYASIWARGEYPIPSEGTLTPSNTTENGGEGTNATPENTDVIQTDPPIEGEIPMEAKGWITTNGLRLRANPSTETNDNVLTHLSKYHYVRIVGQLDGWYHVIDDLTDNGIGGEQSCTRQEGYVSSDYVTTNYANIPND